MTRLAAALAPRSAVVLDGSQSLDLPREVFDAHPEAMVEGWIRFDELGRYSRFFDVGRPFRSVNVTHYERSPNLLFEVWLDRTNRAGLHVAGLLRTNEWIHLAAGFGRSGMRLYVNGLLAATNSFTNGLPQIAGGRARLARSNWDSANARLAGALSEVRLWSRIRTPEEVMAGLWSRADLAAPGLVAAWPLDGSLAGVPPSASATCSEPVTFTPFNPPDAGLLPHPAILWGRVVTPNGRPVNLAHVRLLGRDGRLHVLGRTGTAGHPGSADVGGAGTFHLAIYATNEPLRLEVVHPSGRVTLPPMVFSAGERRHVQLALRSGTSTVDATNAFVRSLMLDLGMGEPWQREMAAQDIVALGPFPQAAAALAGSLPFESDPGVRERIAMSLRELSEHSPVAVAALLEEGDNLPWIRHDQLAAQIRNRPMPAILREIYTRRTQAIALTFAGVFASFSLLHFFFFVCDRGNQSHGIYAVFTGTGAAGTLLTEWGRTQHQDGFAWFGTFCLAIAYLYGLRTVYSVFNRPVPRRFWILGGLFIGLAAGAVLQLRRGPHVQGWLLGLVLIVAFLVVAEMLRVAWQAYRDRKPGSRLIGVSLLIFFACQLVAPLQAPILLDDVRSTWLFPLGMSVVVVSSSLHLARQFVRTHHALRIANIAIARSQSHFQHEIAEAEKYVRSLLPAPLDEPDIRTDWIFQPSTQLGGDAFGYHWLDQDRLALYLLDACGHGVGAALLSVSALNTLRSPALARAAAQDAADVLAELNRAFPMEKHHHQYFSLWFGIYHRSTRTLRFSSAGHPPAYLIPASGPVQPLRTDGPPIGCAESSTFTESSIQIPHGSALILISDGVYEIVKHDGSPGRIDDFAAALERHRWKHPSDILAWTRLGNEGRPLEDDFSILRIEFPAS